MLSTIPFWTDARKFCGMAPPKILSSHTKPSPRFVGATSITQIPYWPWPPDCLTCRPSARLWRSEEHTSELQSRENLVCRLLLEKKKKKKTKEHTHKKKNNLKHA